ncbi:MAG: hypothetical protein L6Q95_11625 [Planctomycetes bacterium]|nr:hypothetical protein [Planctomycetota bacterium]
MKTPAPPLPGAILACGLALACCSARGGSPDMPWSFSAPPYVHPRIIEDLSTWLSDGGDQVVAINLLDAQGSNRYHGDILTREGPGGASFVYTRDGRAMFGYEHVGTTTSGVHVLLTSDCGGGTGVFVDLMLVRIETDRGFAVDWEGGAIRPARRRLLIRKLGEIPLGDRWSGRLEVRGNDILVGRDEGFFAGRGGRGDAWSGADHVLTLLPGDPGADRDGTIR